MSLNKEANKHVQQCFHVRIQEIGWYDHKYLIPSATSFSIYTDFRFNINEINYYINLIKFSVNEMCFGDWKLLLLQENFRFLISTLFSVPHFILRSNMFFYALIINSKQLLKCIQLIFQEENYFKICYVTN